MPEPTGNGVRAWRTADPRALHWRYWDDDYIAYHRPSGKTHFLNAASYFLLTEFLLEARTAEEVAATLPGESEPAEITAMLLRFEELGLLNAC